MFDQLLGDSTDQLGPVIKICLTQEWGESFEVDVRPFSVDPGMFETMWDSEKRFFAKRFKLANLCSATSAALGLVRRSIAKCINHKVPNSDVLSKAIFKFTAVTAQNQMVSNSSGFIGLELTFLVQVSTEKNTFLADVLHFWTAARLIEGGFSFAGDETLGLGQGSKLHDAPVIDGQIAVLLVDEILEPVRKKVISQLDHIITHKRKERWFELLLATFILLHHYSLATIHQFKISRHTRVS